KKRTFLPSPRVLNPTRSAFLTPGFQMATLETGSGISFSTMPPGLPPWGFGLVCFFTMLMLSTSTRPSASTWMTAPCGPCRGRSIRRRCHPCEFFASQHLGGERDDLHELRGAQLARHGPEDAGADRLELVGQQHRRIAVEADERAVRTPHAAPGTHHHRVIDFALLHLAARDRVLDADLDDVTDGRVAAARAAEHFDAHQGTGAAVVSGIEHRLELNHVGDPFSVRWPSRPLRPGATTCAARAAGRGRWSRGRRCGTRRSRHERAAWSCAARTCRTWGA